jgi:hypothetical protein
VPNRLNRLQIPIDIVKDGKTTVIFMMIGVAAILVEDFGWRSEVELIGGG